MSFIKKLRKNKFVVLATCVIIVSLVYTGVQRVIDNYEFNKNEDFVSEEENLEEKEVQFEEDEMDLVLEETIDVEDEDSTDLDNSGEESTNNEASAGEGVESAGNNTTKANIKENKIYIYITGEVNVPGVVILNEGSRIVDAINSAGGTTSKANVTKVNLVYVLEDGMKVNIPNDNDLKNNPDFEYITLNSGDGGRDDYYSGSSSTGSISSNASTSNMSAGSGSEKKYSVVNINTATQTELETLPGIGPSLALKIINYRKENGKFSSIEEIKNVSGIGESKFEGLKRYITV